MHDEVTGPELGVTTFDDFSQQLGALRLSQGRPSYAEIAARIAEGRTSRGSTPERARIARSTVYDAFRPGRKRLDVELVREILIALRLDEPAVEAWTRAARNAIPGVAPLPVADQPPPTEATVGAEPPPPGPRAPGAPGRRPGRTAVLLLVCLLLNLFGRELVVLLGLPLHLDMTGTAVAAILAGPWWGALVGVATNGIGTTISGVISLPFALVNVAGALVWGYGVRRWGMGRTIPRFFTLNVIAAFVCSCVATPILLLYQVDIVDSRQSITDNLISLAHVAFVGIFLSNLVISFFDKSVSGFVALAVVESRTPTPTFLGLDSRGPDGQRGHPLVEQ